MAWVDWKEHVQPTAERMAAELPDSGGYRGKERIAAALDEQRLTGLPFHIGVAVVRHLVALDRAVRERGDD